MSGIRTSPLAEPEQVTTLLAAAGELAHRREARVIPLLGLAADRCAARVSTIVPLLRAAKERRIPSETRARHTAPDYNLFRLLDRSDWEFTHDRILADLLDPYGSHGQGALFLDLFFAMLAERAEGGSQTRASEIAPVLRELAHNVGGLPPRYEWRITRQTDRIDIRIENPSKSLLVFIENKIQAGEQKDQIRRYLALLEGQQRFRHRLLILLAREDLPTSCPPHLKLSYQGDIRQWLERAIPCVEAPHLRGLVKQYVNFVATWGDGTMPRAWENELMDLLGMKDHIAATLEIGHVIGSLGTRLWSVFFDMTAKKFETAFSLAAWSDGGSDGQTRRARVRAMACGAYCGPRESCCLPQDWYPPGARRNHFGARRSSPTLQSALVNEMLPQISPK